MKRDLDFLIIKENSYQEKKYYEVILFPLIFKKDEIQWG